MIRKWYADQIPEGHPNAGEWEVWEQGTSNAMWPAEGKASWTLCSLNPNLQTLSEEEPEVAPPEYYARMMAAAPEMRRLLQAYLNGKTPLHKLHARTRALLAAIDDGGYDYYEERKDSWE